MTAELDSLLSEYLGKGRKLSEADTAILRKLWDVCVKHAQSGSPGDLAPLRQVHEFMKAIEAELQLRGLELHYHDLRGTAVTLLSEAGCTPQQIATITGHSLKTVHQILERYLARTRVLAEQAIFNFESSPRTQFANQLQTSAAAASAEKRKRDAKQ